MWTGSHIQDLQNKTSLTETKNKIGIDHGKSWSLRLYEAMENYFPSLILSLRGKLPK